MGTKIQFLRPLCRLDWPLFMLAYYIQVSEVGKFLLTAEGCKLRLIYEPQLLCYIATTEIHLLTRIYFEAYMVVVIEIASYSTYRYLFW